MTLMQEGTPEECKARSAIRTLLVKLAAQRFNPGIELMLAQDLIQPIVYACSNIC